MIQTAHKIKYKGENIIYQSFAVEGRFVRKKRLFNKHIPLGRVRIRCTMKAFQSPRIDNIEQIIWFNYQLSASSE